MATDWRKRWRDRLVPRQMPTIFQSEAHECGHACVAMVAAHHGGRLTLADIRGRFVPSSRGTSLKRLIEIAQGCGLDTRAYRIEPAQLQQLSLPCIVHVDLTHYVVLARVSNEGYHVVDPGTGASLLSPGEFHRRFTGIALELDPSPALQRRPVRASNPLGLLLAGIGSQSATVGGILLLAVMLELLSLCAPLLIQVVTDSVIPAADTELLMLMAGGFVTLALVHGLASMARTRLLIRLGEVLSAGWHSLICQRLLHLPYQFFVRRSIGDIHARFGSIATIQRTLTSGFLEASLDGVTASLCLCLMVWYSPLLAAISLLAVAIYGGLRWSSFSAIRAAEKAAIASEAAQQSLLLEILHGVHSIKASDTEGTQLARYSARSRDSAASTASVQALSSRVTEFERLTSRLQRVIVISAGAMLALEGQLTAGMLVAFVTFAGYFSDRACRLVDLVAEWKMLRLHADRLADITDAPGEAHREGIGLPDQPTYAIRMEGVGFRYSPDDPWVLDGLDLVVGEGECVAITGPSGNGKSTLAKVLLGMLEPERGAVLVGGRPIAVAGKRALRQSLGCVLQDDQLFNGSIEENIAAFEPNFDRARIEAAARAARIHGEIMQLPLGYATRLTDMAAALSGGQRQRLVLARALYQAPRLLVLDEASSQLDMDNERAINQAVSALRITRVIIAHRQETLAIADRVLELRDGRLRPLARAGATTAVSVARDADCSEPAEMMAQ